jgi:hypothetical protein
MGNITELDDFVFAHIRVWGQYVLSVAKHCVNLPAILRHQVNKFPVRHR